MRLGMGSATLALIAALSATLALPADQAGIADLGAAGLFRLDRVTVVYPAGSGDVAINRRSAEHRATWLARRYGIDTTVIADDQATPADLGTDLLLLGWDNALLGTERAPRPFERGEESLEFLGTEIAGTDLDLLMFAPSPYDPGRHLFFWSRIDPELDRFLVLPALGSDWAIFDRFVPVFQGLFENGSVWPPQRNRLAEKDHRSDLEMLRATRSTRPSEHYRLDYETSRLSDERAERILEIRERALAAAASRLGTDLADVHIDLFVYADADAKLQLTGVPDPAHSVPRRGELHMIESFALSPVAHEEVHHLAYREFGPCFLTAMYEGLALEQDAREQEEDLDLRVAVMIDQGTLPALEDLVVEAHMSTLPVEQAFPASAILVRWLRESFGDRRFARAYTLQEGSLEALAGAIGRPVGKLTREWKRWTGARAKSQRDELAYLKLMAEIREARLVGDDAALAEKLRTALRLKPHEPLVLLQLGKAETRLGEYDLAQQRLEELLALPLTPDSGFRIRGHFELGRLFDVRGMRERALEQYRLVLELPANADLHLRAREAIETPVTREILD